MAESDSEYEEEILVFADFKNNLMPDELDDTKTFMKFIGIESENPIAEVNGNTFKGEYDISMGTHVFFEEEEDQIHVDQIYEKYSKKSFKYLNKTNKVLQFSRIFVEPESIPSDSRPDSDPSKTDNRSNLAVDITYEEALRQLKTREN